MNKTLAFQPRRLHLAITTLSAALFIAGCAVQPQPLKIDEAQQRVSSDLQAMFDAQEPLSGPLTLEQAQARAIKYNLEGRLRLMEQALAMGQLDVARYDMLPRIAASAGYAGRSNVSASSSESVLTRTQSLEPSTSLDDNRRVADLTVAWNVLDFGVSYVTAKQHADRALILQERRRKAVQNIMQQVNAAWWRAVAAERLLGRIDPLLERVRAARDDSAAIADRQLGSPIEALTYQRTLLETLSQLEAQRKELVRAKTELSALINLPPQQPLTLALPAETRPLPDIALDMAQLENLALGHRPELREEQYQARISAAETKKAMLRMLPGLELSAGAHYDSNSYLVNNDWADYGARVTWNLLNVLSAPANIRYAESAEQVAAARRQALSMAVLTQLHIARANYAEARRRYDTASDIHTLQTRITEQLRAAGESRRIGELAVIQGELNALQATLQRDLAYAEADNAYGQIFLSIGADPLPPALPTDDIQGLSERIAGTVAAWARGELAIDDMTLDLKQR